ncbi:hypothetical protein ATCC90586_002780 [Pythium insidiosum]|nr:hypothetical protein ATCC90586_002780 [Pythium insidiosum]
MKGTRLRFKKAQAKKPFRKQKKIPSLKNRIRALERFLKRENIDAATKAAKEAELKHLHDERDGKERLEEEKKLAEKYKKPRFFERVKVMRKLKQCKKAIGQASDAKERHQLEKEFEENRKKMMYIYYYPKAERYISLFPARPLSEEDTQRQQELLASAAERFEEEQPEEAFERFCYAHGDDETSKPRGGAAAAATLLVKKPSKDGEKKKNKKPKKDKTEKDPQVKRERVLADEDDVEDLSGDAEMASGAKDGTDSDEDDFFLE